MSADELGGLAVHLTGATLGRPHEHHAELGSTNDRAAAWAREGAPHGATVTADAQRAGRGRHGRVWFAPPGESLLASVVLRPDTSELGALGLVVGVGLRDALATFGAHTALKWPNDVLVGGRKLAGILCESRWVGSNAEVVVGFGINVSTDVFPAPLDTTATSLAREGLAPPGRAVLLARVLAALEPPLARFFAHGFGAVRDEYLAHTTFVGTEVEIDDGRERRRVVAESLDSDGALRVRPLGGGASERIEAADLLTVADPASS